MERYIPHRGYIEGRNLPNFSNHYIFQRNTSFFIMAGDRPLLRLGCLRCLLGTLRLYACGKPLDEMQEITSRLYPRKAEWDISEGAFHARVTVVSPGESGFGLILKAEANAALEFRYGGICVKQTEGGYGFNPKYNLSTYHGDLSLKSIVYSDEWFEGNHADEALFIEAPEVNEFLNNDARMHLRTDGSAHAEGAYLTGKMRNYLSIGIHSPIESFESAFAAGEEANENMFRMFEVNTPDEALNMLAWMSASNMDAAWHPPKSMHGTLTWNVPYVGWLMHSHHLVGHTDRSKETLKVYWDAMVKEETLTERKRRHKGSMPAQDSRFYGQGYIQEDQHFYNMQTQFFHQLIGAWRFGADEETAELLKNALRLHIRREDECFDPDGTGLYESVINTWPTDSVCCFAGGSLEETCYMYTACLAMADLTEGEEREYYRAKAEKIKKAFFDTLWIKDKGYPAAFIERCAHKRLQENAWMYSAFLPTQCGLLDAFESAQAVYYPRWALDRNEEGLFWMSNWTPGIWSVRECGLGENMQLAIADMKAGDPEGAMNVFTALANSQLHSELPAYFYNLEGATQYCYAVIEGLFGYAPDYPNGRVTISPQIPYAWENAAIRTSDFSIEYTRSSLKGRLLKKADTTIRMRLYGDDIENLKGAETYRLLPGIGGKILEISLPSAECFDISFTLVNPHPFEAPVLLNALPEGEIYNPQGITAESTGHHMAFEKADGYWRKLLIDLGPDPEYTSRVEKQRKPLPENACFRPISLQEHMNCDVQKIFKQEYLSPRPERGETLEIGTDGFELWIFGLIGVTAPEITLTKRGTVLTEKNIPLRIEEGDKNIAFASIWDNFPTEIELPVNDTARAIALAVAGSVNPMLCGMELARFIFTYEDGEEEILPLVSPQNFLQLCAYPARAANGNADFHCRKDVFNPYDEPLLRDFTPEVLPLGENLRAMVITWPLKENKKLQSLRLEALSPEIVAGLMAATLIQ